MKMRCFFLYLMALTIPLFLGLLVWQSNRYQNLSGQLYNLEKTQEEWIESNKRLIAGIAEYSSPERIGSLAKNTSDLQKIQPEHLLQIKIEGKGNGL
jgi:cell division protein FtsL